MSSIKKLVGQTAWYGMSTIFARFINYLLTPYLTFKFTESQYGEMSIIYAFIPFMNVVFTYGMETTYFRYANKENENSVYNTASISLLFSSILLFIWMILLRSPLSHVLEINQHPEYLILTACIITMDAFSTIPFSKLRQDNRPIKFAMIKMGGIIMNIVVLFFCLSISPWIYQHYHIAYVLYFYNPNWLVGYVLIANLIQSTITLTLLYKEWLGFRWNFDKKLWKQMMWYSLPLLVAGFGGMINETFDRIMLGWWAPFHTIKEKQAQVGIYSANYKLSILITLSVQAFRMGAEPFFFKQVKEKNAPAVYARVMKFFVITICGMFLFVMLFINIWKHFISNPHMWEGLKVVPILLLANMFLGIYYNLSIWYKITERTMVGAWITVIGAVITLIINYFFIPYFSYMACAWATFACYGSMMVISFLWGQKAYRIPYNTWKLVGYILLSVMIYKIHSFVFIHTSITHIPSLLGSVLLGILFIVIIFFAERKEWNTIVHKK